jgi:hypothetical protein
MTFTRVASERGVAPVAFLLSGFTCGMLWRNAGIRCWSYLMSKQLRKWLAPLMSAMLALSFAAAPVTSLAQEATTGTISGVVSDAQTGAPLANVKVTASSPSGTRTSSTDTHGFYSLQALSVDTYTVSFESNGYQALAVPGVTVQQAMTVSLNERLSKSLVTIAKVTSRAAGNLVQPNQTADVYTVSGDQLNAVSGGNELHKTLYQYIDTIPGITVSGFGGQPRIHGGSVTDEQYEFDGIPIRDRMTGFFTTNLSNIGINNVEVYTGGLGSQTSDAGLGVINTVVKNGTYPGFASFGYGANVGGNQRLMQFEAEYGGATADRRYSWYIGIDKTGSQNEWANNATYPAYLVEGYNGPGPVYTTDLVGNFHYRPNNKDDFQFLIQNGLGDFIFSDLMTRGPGQPVPLTANPCPGYTVGATATGATGGIAPNGQTCPLGLYFGQANTQGGLGGNIWHHYSGIGKLQWNHIINDHSSLAFRLAENYNEYIFDQPIVDANIASIENSPDFGRGPSVGCPAYPYSPGTPIPVSSGGSECAMQDVFFNTGYLGNRRSEMWLGSLDYTNQLSANATIRAGIGQEYDDNLDNSYFTFYFNGDGSWPGINSESTYPDHVPSAYVNGTFKFHKFTLEPGLRWERMYYDYPAHTVGKTSYAAGPYAVGILNPTFAGTYTFDPKNVVRASWTDSTSFVGTAYVYRDGSATYNPGGTFSAAPTLFHSADLMFEHQFDPNTSIRIGPWWNRASNVFFTYRPVLSINPVSGAVSYGPTQGANGGYRSAMGAELGFSHINHDPVGVSYWLSATYDNFWTNITSSLTGSYGGGGLPGFLPTIRNSGDPLISATLTADVHVNRWKLLPMVYYQGPSPYQTGECYGTARWNSLTGYPWYSTCASTSSFLQKPVALMPQLWSKGWWWSNATLEYGLGPQKNTEVGIQVTNLFNNQSPTIPCYSNVQPNTPALAPGCSPNYTYAGASNYPSTGYIYQNTSETPRSVELFLQTRLP